MLHHLTYSSFLTEGFYKVGKKCRTQNLEMRRQSGYQVPTWYLIPGQNFFNFLWSKFPGKLQLFVFSQNSKIPLRPSLAWSCEAMKIILCKPGVSTNCSRSGDAAISRNFPLWPKIGPKLTILMFGFELKLNQVRTSLNEIWQRQKTHLGPIFQIYMVRNLDTQRLLRFSPNIDLMTERPLFSKKWYLEASEHKISLHRPPLKSDFSGGLWSDIFSSKASNRYFYYIRYLCKKFTS